MTEPLPCPYCGEAPKVLRGPHIRIPAVECTYVLCTVNPVATGADPAEALARWNTRAPVKDPEVKT